MDKAETDDANPLTFGLHLDKGGQFSELERGSQMKVMVTGGGGYIGSVLVRSLLDHGFDVTVLDRLFFGQQSLEELGNRVKIIRGDVRYCDPDTLRGINAVFDLASLSNDHAGELDPNKTLEINFEGRVRIARLAKKRHVSRYVLASTCSVYGANEDVSTETSVLNPLTTYAKANTLAEQEILHTTGSGFCRTALRQATAYGLSKRMRFDLAVNGMVLAYHKRGKILIMRDGTQWRPFVHVKDISKAFLIVLDAEKSLVDGEVFNVGSNEQNFQIKGLAQTVADAMGVPFEYEWYGSHDARNYRVSFDKIRKTLDFRPEHTPRDGAQKIQAALKSGELDGDDPRCITVEWYKKLLSTPELAKEIVLNGAVI